MEKQKLIYESGNELAAYAAKQINYHVMGYYPITPSTQIAEALDQMKADGEHTISLVVAEGEHSAAGICYGASVGGGRVFNATSANGLLYSLEQLPVQSGTRFPMVLNVACRTISGPLSIKGDHSDIMYALNTGWIILFAHAPQEVYDMNICALKIAERVMLPVIVAFDGFFTSHQKRKCQVFEDDNSVKDFLGQYQAPYSALDLEHPVSIGSYMNEPDVLNNKYQLHQAMQEAYESIPSVFREFGELSGREYDMAEGYCTQDAEVLLYLLGSAYHTAKEAVDKLRKEGNVVILFQTGCGMVVTTGYPKTSFRIPYVHNLFQNGAATLSGLEEMFQQRQKRGEYPEGSITFLMVSGDGGMDIGMGSAIGTALRNNRLILFEYDNGGYMNTGYQLSYSTPKGAKSATSHVGKESYGKNFYNKDMPMIMAAANIPYVATVAESNPADFVKKAAKAKAYAQSHGTVYIRALSACPLNWGDAPDKEREVIGAAVNCCYFPFYEIENGITTLSYNPEKTGKKIPVEEWFGMMGRTKHLTNEKYGEVMESIQQEVDRRFTRLLARAEHPEL